MRLTSLAALVLVAGLGAGASRAAAPPPKLELPLACEIGRTCEVQNYVDRDPGPGAVDYHCGRRTYDGHNGVDIRVLDLRAQQRGVAVLAAAAGKVLRARDGVPDISIREAGAPPVAGQECGNGLIIDHGGGWETQYCHMARGSLKVKPGEVVAAGQPLGLVGLSGQTEFPHLHIAVRRDGQIVDPFAPEPGANCTSQAGLWSPAAARQLAYKAGAILNAGFAGARATADDVEKGALAPPSRTAPALLAYMRAVGLQQGDVLELVLTDPKGAQLAAQRLAPLDRDKAQYFAMLGRKRPPGGWTPGAYRADLRVYRDGKPVLSRRIQVTL